MINDILYGKSKSDRTAINISRKMHEDLLLLVVKRSNDSNYRVRICDLVEEAFKDLFAKYNINQF